MKRLSIGMRLTIWYLVLFVGAQTLFGAGMWLILRYYLYDLADDSLESQVEDLRNFMLAQKKDATIAKLQEEVNESYALEHPGDYLEISAEDGSVIYRSAFLRDHPLAPIATGQLTEPVYRNRRLAGHPLRFIVERLEANGHVYTVTMGLGTEDVVETLSVFRTYLFLLGPLLFLVAAGGGYWLSRRALSPVDTLVRTAHEISGVNLNSRLPKLTTGDELQRLADTLNEMLDRIEGAFQRVTQFTADASHELRTPVSLIRTEAELALRRSRGEEEYKESLRNILLEAERTTAMIEELLALARADSGRETLHMEPVNLAEMLGSTLDSWKQVATIRNLGFSADIGEDVFVLADSTALRRVADLLLDNAFKYTSAPGTVRLLLEREKSSAVFSVADSGPGIAKEEQSRIFERFYRVDQARSRDQGGAGLGLAIAKWIVTQHHGTITVKSKPGDGATFRVELPLIAAPVQSPHPAGTAAQNP
ncbi:MAG TPA: heavy metal sensor histidine kinase [Candidatus Sulfotelmatobacter sp.]|nr:heavy metal sensor histidine kinase [Candidatus Sulfotelmatobacter sp.]